MTTININIKNSDSVNFSMMIKLKEGMEFVITSLVSYTQIIANEINFELFLYGKSYCLFQRYDGFHPYIPDVP